MSNSEASAPPKWVDVALEEYRTLRAESLDSIGQAQTTLRGGVVALGVLAGLALRVDNAGEIAQATVALAGPALAVVVAMQWLLETLRSVRAGSHIAGLEKEIATRMDDDPPLRWEHALRGDFSPRDTFAYHWTVLGALLVAALPSAALGLRGLVNHDEWIWFVAAVCGEAAMMFVLWRFVRRIHREITRLACEPPAAFSSSGQAHA